MIEQHRLRALPALEVIVDPGGIGGQWVVLPFGELYGLLPRLYRLLLALGHDADEAAVAESRDDTGQGANGGGIEFEELRTDRRRPHHTAEQHSPELHVVNEARQAGDFRGNVESRRAGTDHAKL